MPFHRRRPEKNQNHPSFAAENPQPPPKGARPFRVLTPGFEPPRLQSKHASGETRKSETSCAKRGCPSFSARTSENDGENGGITGLLCLRVTDRVLKCRLGALALLVQTNPELRIERGFCRLYGAVALSSVLQILVFRTSLRRCESRKLLHLPKFKCINFSANNRILICCVRNSALSLTRKRQISW